MKLCDICGTVHESYQAHVFASNTVANKPIPVANTVANTVANKKSKYKDVDARKQYMRDYMRKRRNPKPGSGDITPAGRNDATS